jgi:hypothetical protein
MPINIILILSNVNRLFGIHIGMGIVYMLGVAAALKEACQSELLVGNQDSRLGGRPSSESEPHAQ